MSLRAFSLRARHSTSRSSASARALREAMSICALMALVVVLFWNGAAQAQSLIPGSVGPINGVYPQAYGVVTDAAGNVYYVDDNSGTLWKATPPSGTSQFWSLSQLVGGFSGAQGIAMDASGNIFIADTGNNEVKEVLALGNYSQTNVLVGGAVFKAPAALAVDGSGNILVADTGNNAIKLISLSGGYGSASQVSTSFSLQQPAGIALDAGGNLYLSNTGGNTVLRLTAASGWSNGTTLGSGWKSPKGLAVDGNANVYVVDSGNSHVVEVLSAGGYTTQTLVTQYAFNQPVGIGLDSYGDAFVALPQLNEIFEIAPPTTQFPATPVLGTGVTRNVFFTGNVNGINASVGSVQALTLGASSASQFSIVNGSNTCGSVGYQASCSVQVTFAPRMPGVIRGAVVAYDRFGNPLGTAFVAGIGTGPQLTFPGNGSKLQVAVGSFLGPQDVAFDGSGNLFVADQGHQVVERYNPNTNSLATVGPYDLSTPQSVALDGAGNLFISDNGASQVRESFAPNYTQTVTVGSGFSSPKGIAVDAAGNLFVTDTGNHAVKELTAASGYQTTLILGGGFSFPEPTDVAVDSKGNLYVADRTAGAVYALSAACGYCSAQTFVSGFYNPRGVTVDASDSLYVADTDDGRIYEIASVGGVYPTKVLLLGGLNYPAGLATDSNGNLWTAESGGNNNWITELALAQPPAALAFNTTPQYQPSSDSPRPLLLANRGNAPLIFSTPGSNTNPAISNSFTEGGPSGSTCPIVSTGSAPGQLAAAAQCELDVSFVPQSLGSITGQLVFTDNNLNQAGYGAGTQTISLSGTSLFVPAISSISPSQGPVAGGATVTITGSNFSSITKVSFGTYAAQSFTVKNSTTIVAVTPLVSSAQTVDVIVSTSSQSSSPSASDQYSFVKTAATIAITTGSQFSYNGNPIVPRATTSPANLGVIFTWNGSTTMPTNAGTYTIVATINDYRYTGSTSATVTIVPTEQDHSCFVNPNGGNTFVYNGNPQTLPVSTTPNGLSFSVTYTRNGNSVGVPVDPGTYTETCTITDPNWTPVTNSYNLTINKGTAFLSIVSSVPYTGLPISPPITVYPSSEAAHATVTYAGLSSPPVNSGTYNVTATINDIDYYGTASGQVTITRIPVTITIPPTTVVYDGNPHGVNVTVSPNTSIAVTYNGSSSLPTNAGTYAVSATTTDPNHSGSATGTLTITQAPANISTNSFTVQYDGNAHPVTVTDPHSVSYSVTYNGSSNPPVSAGTYNVAVQVTDPNWTGSATGTVTITKIAAQISVSNQSVFYDARPLSILTASSTPNIPLQITYNGSTNAPTQVGSYAVVVSAADPTDYAATPATATFTIVARQLPAQPVTPLGATSAKVSATVYFNGQTTLNGSRSTAVQVLTTGLPNLDFKDAGTGTCTPGATYQPGSSCTVDFTFTPTGVGNRHGVIQLWDNTGAPISGAATYISGIGKASLITFPGSPAVTTLPTSGRIGAAVADAAGNLYFFNTDAQTLNEYIAATGQINQLASGVSGYPWGMAIDGAGNLFAGNAFVVEEFVAANNYAMTSFSIPSLSFPTGLVADSKGNLFINDLLSENVQELAPIDGYSSSTVISSGYSEAFSVAMDGNDNLFVQDTAAGTVYELTAASGYTAQTAVLQQGSTVGIASDAAGNIYVNAGNSVNVYTAADGYKTSQPVIAAPFGNNVLDIAADASGHIYVIGGSSITRVDLTVAPAISGFTAADGTVSFPQSAPVVNAGTNALTFASITSSSPLFPFDASTTCFTSTPLASGSLCTISTDFAPTTTGPASGELDLTDNSLTVTGSVQRILLSGTGTPGMKTIIFIPPASPAPAGTSAALVATASNGDPVTFSVTPGTGTASVSGNVITYLTAGTVTVNADSAATANYNAAATVSYAVTITDVPYIFITGSGNVASLNVLGSVTTAATAGGSTGLAVDASGYIWSIGSNGTSLSSFTPAGVLGRSYSPAGIASASALAIDGASNVVVANGNGTISVVSNAGVAVSTTSGSTSSAPSGVAVDLSGNIWVANPTANTVDEIIGGAAPSSPLANAVQSATPGVKP